MNAILKISVICFSLLMCTSCMVTNLFVKEHYRVDSFSVYRPEKLGFFVLDSGGVKGYRNAFKKLYSNQEAFNKEVEERTLPVVRQAMRGSKVVPVSPEIHAQLSKLIHTNHLNAIHRMAIHEEIAKILDTADLDGLVFVNHWLIEESWKTSSQFVASTLPGEMHRTQQTQEKECRIYLRGGLIDDLGRTLYYGESKGVATTQFFAFKTTVKEALADSVDKFGDMISGKVHEKHIANF